MHIEFVLSCLVLSIRPRPVPLVSLLTGSILNRSLIRSVLVAFQFISRIPRRRTDVLDIDTSPGDLMLGGSKLHGNERGAIGDGYC